MEIGQAASPASGGPLRPSQQTMSRPVLSGWRGQRTPDIQSAAPSVSGLYCSMPSLSTRRLRGWSQGEVGLAIAHSHSNRVQGDDGVVELGEPARDLVGQHLRAKPCPIPGHGHFQRAVARTHGLGARPVAGVITNSSH